MPHLKCVTLLVLIGLSLFSSPRLWSAETTRPNVVLIFSDDQGMHDVGCYGSEIPTPNIDSLATQGMKFNQWYVASSICTPSRYGLLTGQFPSRSESQLLNALMFLGPEDAERGIQAGETTFASLLQKNGYRTALIGKWHLGHGNKHFLPTHHGFDSFIGHTGGCIDFFMMRYGKIQDWYHNEEHHDEVGYATELITDEAVKFLKQQTSEQPFYLHLAYNAPHFGKSWDRSKDLPVNIMQPHPKDLHRVVNIEDELRRQFAAMVVSLDDGVGKVLSTLEETNQAKNTIVIFMTDHGGDPKYGGNNLPFRGDKASLFEGGIRVPCLIRWPGVIAAQSENNTVCSSLDIFPTICDWANIKVDDQTLDGRNIAGLLDGSVKQLPPRDLVWHLGTHDRLDRGEWHALRSGDWKYLTTPEGDEFLFNLKNDPHEKKNLVDQEPRKLAEIKKRRQQIFDGIYQNVQRR